MFLFDILTTVLDPIFDNIPPYIRIYARGWEHSIGIDSVIVAPSGTTSHCTKVHREASIAGTKLGMRFKT
jgi:hypothetical protein